MKKSNKLFSTLYVVLCFAFFYVPILVLMLFSFNSSKSLTHFTGFSFKWYANLINNNEIMSAVFVSLSIAVISTAVSTVLGTLTAIGLSKNRKILKETLLTINDIPITNPDIVTAIGLMLLFSSFKIEKGYITMLLAHIAFSTPYVITSVYPKVRKLDPNIANAAMDLGATPFEALTKVIIPMIKPGIFAGVLLAITMSFDDFVISYFVSGNGVMNISIIVYNMTKRTNPSINALSTIVILVIFILLIVSNLIPVLTKNLKTINKYVNKIGVILLTVAVAVSAFVSLRREKNVLKVYNAGEYICKDLIQEFEKENNCQVIYETFDSNESLYTKIFSGELYDVLVPSDYMVDRLIKEDYLRELDWSKIPNRKNLLDSVQGREFDPENKYSASYFWGSVGILYNKSVIDPSDLSAGWEILRNPKYKNDIYMYDSERDSFMVALKALGYSMNTENTNELDAAYEWLVQQRKLVSPIYAGDDVIDSMISGNKSMAIVYSGDAAYIMSENPELEYYTPKQGTNIWYASMVIPKTSNNPELAHKFINFMLDVDNATRNSVEVGYTSGVKKAFEYVRDNEYEGISAYVPETNDKNEVFLYQPTEIKKYCADLWVKVKAD